METYTQNCGCNIEVVSLLLKMTIDIVNIPINMVIFHSFLYVYKRAYRILGITSIFDSLSGPAYSTSAGTWFYLKLQMIDAYHDHPQKNIGFHSYLYYVNNHPRKQTNYDSTLAIIPYISQDFHYESHDQWSFQELKLEVLTIQKAYVSGLNFKEYRHTIWLNMW